MFYTYNYFKQYNEGKKIDNCKEFYKKMPKKVLDISCGMGINLSLSELFDFVDYNEIDYVGKTLEHSRKVYPHVHFEVQNAFNLDLEEKFDLAIISAVLILYKNKSDRIELLKNAKNSLNDNGLLIAIIRKDSWLLNLLIQISKLIVKAKKIKLPEDFMRIHFMAKFFPSSLSMFNIYILSKK